MRLGLFHPAVKVRAFELVEGQALVLGRGPEADVELGFDPRVSRRHARVSLLNGELGFEELGSRNGSWHAGTRVERAVRLAPGVVLLLGETSLFLPGPVEVQGPRERGHCAREVTPTLDLGLAGGELDEATLLAPPLSSKRGARFVRPDLVEVRLESKAALERLHRAELAGGHLFVPGASAPSPGARVSVELTVPQGFLRLGAQVARVIAPGERALAAGALLALSLTVEERAAIEDHLDGIQRRLHCEGPPGPPVTLEERAEALRRARRLLELAARDPYAALEVVPSASARSIALEIEALRAALERAAATSSPAEREVLWAGAGALQTIERVLCSRTARLEHDLRSGLLRAEERVAEAERRQGPSMAELRLVFARVFPVQAARAAALGHAAAVALEERRVVEAIDLLRRALRLNPFAEGLRAALEGWERVAEREGL